jgi:hypothetical protein
MSETKLTGYTASQIIGYYDGAIDEGNTEFVLASDADARIAALERERDELRKRVEECELALKDIAGYANWDTGSMKLRARALLRTPPAAQGDAT